MVLKLGSSGSTFRATGSSQYSVSDIMLGCNLRSRTSINEGRLRWLVVSMMDTSTVASECGMLRSGGCCAVAMADVARTGCCS